VSVAPRKNLSIRNVVFGALIYQEKSLVIKSSFQVIHH
jgi:hypothetical protein